MIRARFILVLIPLWIALAGCPDENTSFPDATVGEDIDLNDRGAADAIDTGLTDSGRRDAEEDGGDTGEDGGIAVDSGNAAVGESCSTAVAWPDEGLPFADTTTRSHHREQLTCAGSGAGANAPELWWKLELPVRKSVVLELGTNGWDAVLGARTGTCTIDVESCADQPTLLELPSVSGELFVAVDGFSTGQGTYALSAAIGDPWTLPPSNHTCANATLSPLPSSISAHDFSADPGPILPCGLQSAVYYAVDTTGGALSAIAVPSAAHDVELAVLSTCGDEAITCGSTPGRGVAERIDRLMVPAGRWIVAVGTRTARPAVGSFTLDISEDALCTRDSECALGEACIAALACAPELGFVATSTVRLDIPDGGRIEIPLELFGPASRVARVRARVAFEHPYPEDLVIELRSPGPQPIVVRLRDSSAYEADVTYGRERPADGPGHLEDFTLVETATGTWSLSIEDRAIGDRGFVTGVVLGVE